MNPETRHQLRSLDRALLSLIDERARLLRAVDVDDPGRNAAVDDMLRRHEGPFPAEGIAEVFAAIDRHSAGFAQDRERGSGARIPATDRDRGTTGRNPA